MFRNIIGTATARVTNAILSLIILLINTHHLGKEGLGTIGLVVLGITLILLISNFIGGPALVYLVPRHDVFKLFIPSYIWGVIIAVTGTFLLDLFQLIPHRFVYDIVLLSMIHCLMTVNLYILLGKEKIRTYNVIIVLQTVITTLTLAYFIYIQELFDVASYIYALYSGYILAFILSLTAIWKYLKFSDLSEAGQLVGQILKYGKFIQSANLMQIMNYRLSYYLIEKFVGRAELGLYTVGVQHSEGIWLIGKSVAQVQYARISNVKEMEYSRRITLNLSKFTGVLTVAVVVILLLIPEPLYGKIFGTEFIGIKPVMITLSLGIFATAVSMMFSHFFSGTGKPQHNLAGSTIGFVLTLVLGLIFVPRFGVLAAGLTASIAYFLNMMYLIIVFIKMTETRYSDFMLRKEDFIFFKNTVMDLARKKSNY